MSKKSKAKAAEKRKKEKRTRKRMNQEKYQKWRDMGVNTKSKRSTKGKRRGPRVRQHQTLSCGNLGCQACFGVHYAPFLQNGVPHGMPRWMYNQWRR